MSRSPAPKLAETDLGAPVQASLEAEGWTVYREVRFLDPKAGNTWIADMVIVRGGEVGIVELKTSLGLVVIDQAYRWRRFAHLIYVAVPAEKGRKGAPSNARRQAFKVLEGHGIGVLLIREQSKTEQIAAMRPGAAPLALAALVAVALQPREQRDADADELLASLHPEQRDFSEAGTKNGRRWSPRERAYREIRELLLGEQGNAAPIEDCARAAGSSWRTVTAWAMARKIEGVRLDARNEPPVLQLVAPGQEAPITSARTLKSEWRRFA